VSFEPDPPFPHPSGPTQVSRYDPAGGYTESFSMSAAPHLTGGLPDGTEAVGGLQTLSRSYPNAAGQVSYTDAYFNLSGLTYSTAANLGTENTHFYRTRFGYDSNGQLAREQAPTGTITRTVRDGEGRVSSVWVGTNDTPASGDWSPTNNTGSANMVQVSANVYDGGGVGDGLLTQVTLYPGGGAANRVTQFYHDWRGRLVATKAGVQGTEDTSTHRPITYRTLNNLGQVTQQQLYDGDGVTLSMGSDGVPVAPASSLLRAQQGALYDEQGRPYRTQVYSVNQSTGAVSSSALTSDVWFGHRGQVLKAASPGGLVQKAQYDGAGRVTVSSLSDGGGDSSWADAGTVTGDNVLQQAETQYDKDGNPLLVTTRQRFDSETATGSLGDPTNAPKARVSYVAAYYDAAGRTTATVDVGTNGGSAYTRPASAPARSDTVLVTSYGYAADEVQQVALTGSPTGGTFTLSFGGQTTSGIAYNASASAVQSALQALSSIGSGNALVSGAAGGPWQVRFAGALAGADQAQLTANAAGLTGGSSPAVAVTTTSQGGDGGRVQQVTDPRGLVGKADYDLLGRTVRQVAAFTDFVPSGADTQPVGRRTSYSYTWSGSTGGVQSQTVTLPTVSADENGPGTADTSTTYFDGYGNPVWGKDGDGFLSYAAYDPVTGAVTKTIDDVDTTRTGDFSGLPTGWSTPTGGGLHLLTQVTVDGLGRATQVTDPAALCYRSAFSANTSCPGDAPWRFSMMAARSSGFRRRADTRLSCVCALS
jgi:YD repeat-containing protein